MIDTDKYEGHTPAPWELNNPNDEECLIPLVGALKSVSSANQQLIADAPLLLEEVLRLREQFKLAYDWVDTQFPDGGMADFAEYIGDEEDD